LLDSNKGAYDLTTAEIIAVDAFVHGVIHPPAVRWPAAQEKSRISSLQENMRDFFFTDTSIYPCTVYFFMPPAAAPAESSLFPFRGRR